MQLGICNLIRQQSQTSIVYFFPVVFLARQHCLHVHSFACLIRWTPSPTFSDIAISNRQSDIFFFQLGVVFWSVVLKKCRRWTLLRYMLCFLSFFSFLVFFLPAYVQFCWVDLMRRAPPPMFSCNHRPLNTGAEHLSTIYIADVISNHQRSPVLIV